MTSVPCTLILHIVLSGLCSVECLIWSVQRPAVKDRYSVVMVAGAFLINGCVTETMTVAITATKSPKSAVSTLLSAEQISRVAQLTLGARLIILPYRTV